MDNLFSAFFMEWELILFVCGTLAVVAGCLVPANWLPPLPNDKLLHFAAFAVLTLLAARIVHDKFELLHWLAGLFIAGWIIEGLQSRVPGRKFCWRDIAANTGGIAVAAIVSAPLFGI